MKISVAKAEGGTISISFDGKVVTLNTADTKTLLLELTKVLIPEGAFSKSPTKKAAELVAKIKVANDLGIQKLLRVAEHDDLLVLLKFGEEDGKLKARIFGNMTEKSGKIFTEDLNYRFQDGVGEAELEKSINRLSVITRELEEEGTLTTTAG